MAVIPNFKGSKVAKNILLSIPPTNRRAAWDEPELQYDGREPPKAWLARLRQLKQIHGYNDKETLKVAKKCLKGSAQLWFRIHQPQSFDALRTGLHTRFAPGPVAPVVEPPSLLENHVDGFPSDVPISLCSRFVTLNRRSVSVGSATPSNRWNENRSLSMRSVTPSKGLNIKEPKNWDGERQRFVSVCSANPVTTPTSKRTSKSVTPGKRSLFSMQAVEPTVSPKLGSTACSVAQNSQTRLKVGFANGTCENGKESPRRVSVGDESLNKTAMDTCSLSSMRNVEMKGSYRLEHVWKAIPYPAVRSTVAVDQMPVMVRCVVRSGLRFSDVGPKHLLHDKSQCPGHSVSANDVLTNDGLKTLPRSYKDLPLNGQQTLLQFKKAIHSAMKGDWTSMSSDFRKFYLQTYGMRTSGAKREQIHRIRDHLELTDGSGTVKYPRSSFLIDCTGDLCLGDVIFFEQRLREGYDVLNGNLFDNIKRTTVGRVVKDSKSPASEQVLTIEVYWSKGPHAFRPMRPVSIRAVDLNRLNPIRQRWISEEARKQMLEEKKNSKWENQIQNSKVK